MRIVLLGANGQLARDMAPLLPGHVVPLTRAEADLTDPVALRAAITAAKPTHVVNTAAYNLVDKAESEPHTAFAVNAFAVRELALICRDLDVTLMQFSTDYVFGLDSGRNVPYRESDAAAPQSAYGVSKLAGELFVQALCPKHFVVRVCGLYGLWGSGGKGGNFVETMLKVAAAGKPLKVVSDQTCTPTSTMDVANAMTRLIQTEAYGLYHCTNAGRTTWHDFAATIFRMADVEANLTPIPAKDYAAAAQRPAYSVLDNSKLVELGIPALQPWVEALGDYLARRRGKTHS